jgi:hypothetical protein
MIAAMDTKDMRYTTRVGIRPRTALVLVAIAVLSHVVVADEIIDRVLAVVAGDLIMLSDVRAAREFGLVDAAAAPDPDRAILSRLIDRALILDEVERYAPPEPPADAVDRALDAARARFPSADAYRAALSRASLDERQLRGALRQNLRIRAYLDQRFVTETAEHIETIIEGWVAGLRRRAEIIDLSAPDSRP